MVVRDAKEKAAFVALGIGGYVAAMQVGTPDVLAGAFLLLFGAIAPAVYSREDEQAA